MRVISQSMYNKLKDLTDDQLKFALRGFGISEAEMDAHVERAKQVVTAAEKGIKYYKQNPETKWRDGALKVVPDEEFKKLKLDELATYQQVTYRGQQGMNPMNLFGHMQLNLREMSMDYEEQEAARREQNKAFETLKSEVAIGEDNRANPGAIKRQQKKADQL